jgi:hypothetical protein
VETLINRVIEQGLAPYLLREIDLVVFPHHVDGDRYVAEAVELLSEREYEALDGGRLPSGAVEKGGRTLYWNVVARRDTEGQFSVDYAHPHLDDGHRSLGFRLFHRLAETTDREVDDVEAEFHRKHRYVQYLVQEGIADFEDLFGFVSDLRTDEAATVERAKSEPSGGE